MGWMPESTRGRAVPEAADDAEVSRATSGVVVAGMAPLFPIGRTPDHPAVVAKGICLAPVRLRGFGPCFRTPPPPCPRPQRPHADRWRRDAARPPSSRMPRRLFEQCQDPDSSGGLRCRCRTPCRMPRRSSERPCPAGGSTTPSGRSPSRRTVATPARSRCATRASSVPRSPTGRTLPSAAPAPWSAPCGCCSTGGSPTASCSTVMWHANRGNWPSRKLAWRLGFRFDGTLRQWLPHRGELRNGWSGTLLRGEALAPRTTVAGLPGHRGERAAAAPGRGARCRANRRGARRSPVATLVGSVAHAVHPG